MKLLDCWVASSTDHGSSVCFISIIRLTILTRTDFSSIDETWNGADFTMWCNVEASIAIVSGKDIPSLPCQGI